MTWTLRIPAAIAQSRALTPKSHRTDRIHVSQVLDGQLVLEVDGFETETEARDSFGRVEVALLLGAMRQNIPLRWPQKIGCSFACDPTKAPDFLKGIDAVADGREAVAYRTAHRLGFLNANDASLIHTSKIEPFADAVRVAFSDPRMSQWLADPGLRLSFEAFASAQGSEGSLPPRVRFMLLVIGVEALLPTQSALPVVVSLVEETLARLQALKPDATQAEAEALGSLEGSLRLLKNRSIGQRFKELATTALDSSSTPKAERDEIVASLGKLYAIRCKLVHEHKDQVEGKHVSMMQRIAECAINARLETRLGVSSTQAPA